MLSKIMILLNIVYFEHINKIFFILQYKLNFEYNFENSNMLQN